MIRGFSQYIPSTEGRNWAVDTVQVCREIGREMPFTESPSRKGGGTRVPHIEK